MKRAPPLIALALVLCLGFAPPLLTSRGQNPVVPPGPVQPIVPPAPIVVPTPAPPLVPVDEDVPVLRIAAKVNGVEVPDDVVTAPPRSLVVLTLTGSAMTPTTAVTWSLNAPSVSLELTQEGRHVAYSPFGDAPMLFTASINGEASPHVAQRWIVAGGVPGPTPPEPGPQPPTPEPIPEQGEFRILIVEETGDRGALTKEQVAIFSAAEIRAYAASKTAKQDGFLVLDVNDDLSRLSPAVQAAAAKARDYKLPVVVLSKGSKVAAFDFPANVAEALKLFRQWGGE